MLWKGYTASGPDTRAADAHCKQLGQQEGNYTTKYIRKFPFCCSSSVFPVLWKANVMAKVSIRASPPYIDVNCTTAVHCVKQFYPRNNGGKSSIVAVFIILMAVTTGHYSWSSQNYKLCWSVPSKLINHGILPKSWSMQHKMLSQKGTLAVML